MVAGGALLRPAAVQGGVPEVDLVPTKVRQLGVRASSRRDCSIYSGWRYQFQCLAAGTIFVREFTIRKI